VKTDLLIDRLTRPPEPARTVKPAPVSFAQPRRKTPVRIPLVKRSAVETAMLLR
jgi:hypothetical protein